MTPTASSKPTSWHNRCHASDMRHSFHKSHILACVVLAAAVTASARTFPLEKITRGNQEFFGTVSYDVEKAYAGNHNLELLISLSTKDTAKLELNRFDSPDQAKIQFKEISNDEFVDPATGNYLVVGVGERIASYTIEAIESGQLVARSADGEVTFYLRGAGELP